MLHLLRFKIYGSNCDAYKIILIFDISDESYISAENVDDLTPHGNGQYKPDIQEASQSRLAVFHKVTQCQRSTIVRLQSVQQSVQRHL